jgi:hypothetical protein
MNFSKGLANVLWIYTQKIPKNICLHNVKMCWETALGTIVLLFVEYYYLYYLAF